MGELGFNKIAAVGLITVLSVIGLNEASHFVFHEKHLDEPAYAIDIPLSAAAGVEVVEAVLDLGALLAGADIAKGERSVKAKCSACHTVDQGGANLVGPNLWNVVGRGTAMMDGFGYSEAMMAMGKSWSYEELDGYLENPRGYVKGTAMSFAGLKKTPERMNVLAYLASLSDTPMAFPEPLVVEEEIAVALADDIGNVTDEDVADSETP